MPFLQDEPTITAQVNWHDIDGYNFMRRTGRCTILVVHGYQDDEGVVDFTRLTTEELVLTQPEVIERLTALIDNKTLKDELYDWAVAYAIAHGAIPGDTTEVAD